MRNRLMAMREKWRTIHAKTHHGSSECLPWPSNTSSLSLQCRQPVFKPHLLPLRGPCQPGLYSSTHLLYAFISRIHVRESVNAQCGTLLFLSPYLTRGPCRLDKHPGPQIIPRTDAARTYWRLAHQSGMLKRTEYVPWIADPSQSCGVNSLVAH